MANKPGIAGADWWRTFFHGALVATGMLLAAGESLAQEDASGSILPSYPTSKRQIVAHDALDATAVSGKSTTLKWRTSPARVDAKITRRAESTVQPAAMNLRVGEQASSGVAPAINLVPAESIVRDATSLRLAQGRSRFDEQPSLDPPSVLPPTSEPAVIDDDPTRTPSIDEPLDEPSLDGPTFAEPSDDDPAPAELPPLADPTFPDPEAASDDKKEEIPCRENYRDTNCCEQNIDCRDAWSKLERNPIRGFTRSFLDITPLYRPDVRYAEAEQIDQEKARQLGLALNTPRVWKGINGKPLGLAEDGTVLGLDGEDWQAEYERASRAADSEIGGIRPPRPIELKGRVTNYKRGASEVAITTEAGDELTLQLNQLSLDDNQWLNGRSWRDAEGRVLARGRFHDYEWGRILVMEDSGRIAVVPLGKLGDEDLCYVGAYWGEGVGLPAECRLRGTPQMRNFTMITYTWKASGLCHKPLYFEEVQLERYGHTFGPLAQPVVSGAHFFANIAILPYKMGIHPCNECQYALGYYRPGDCAPYMIPPVPLSVRGGLYQAGAVVGAVALFP